MRFPLPALLLLSLAACSGGTVDDIVVDSGPDAHTATDGGGIDAGHTVDSGVMTDAGTPDSGTVTDSGSTTDSGTATDAGTTADGGACMSLAADGTGIGTHCSLTGSECPTGYFCWAMEGFAVSYQCEIDCSMDCQCPSGTSCQVVTDKAGPHHFCQAT